MVIVVMASMSASLAGRMVKVDSTVAGLWALENRGQRCLVLIIQVCERCNESMCFVQDEKPQYTLNGYGLAGKERPDGYPLQ